MTDTPTPPSPTQGDTSAPPSPADRSSSSSGDGSLVVSFLLLRRAIGYLGSALPIVLVLGGAALFSEPLLGSMSAYYYTPMRDVFVGTLFAMGVFLLSYDGHDRTDRWAGNLGCLCAIGVALFPTTPEGPVGYDKLIGGIHYTFAATLLGTLAFFSLHLFRKTHKGRQAEGQKAVRNLVYKWCGIVIVICIVSIFVYSLLLPGSLRDSLAYLRPVYVGEFFAFEAFALAWLVKGERLEILNDKD